MSKAERAVLDRLRTSHPLMEVYIQNVAPDEARGWVPTDDNYFLGQLHFDDGPTLRPLGQKEQRGVRLRLISGPPSVGNAFAAMVAPTGGNSIESDTHSGTCAGVPRRNRCFVFDVRPLREGKEGFVGRIWIEDRDYNIVRFNGASLGFGETLSGMLKRKLSLHMDGWRVNVAPGVWVPWYATRKKRI